MQKFLIRFAPLALTITLLSGLVFGVAQQILRLDANDPQIQIAEDAAVALSIGVEPRSLIPPTQTDIASSLSPFITIFDANGVPVASSGILDGQMPKLPSEVFTYVTQHGQDRITWQPRGGVRSALIVTRFSGQKGGFVAVGKSLREVENRTQSIGLIVFAGWLCTLVAIGAAKWLLQEKKK
jgi:hypothetical protein